MRPGAGDRPLWPICLGSVLAGTTVFLDSDQPDGLGDTDPEDGGIGLHRLRWAESELPKPQFRPPAARLQPAPAHRTSGSDGIGEARTLLRHSASVLAIAARDREVASKLTTGPAEMPVDEAGLTLPAFGTTTKPADATGQASAVTASPKPPQTETIALGEAAVAQIADPPVVGTVPAIAVGPQLAQPTSVLPPPGPAPPMADAAANIAELPEPTVALQDLADSAPTPPSDLGATTRLPEPAIAQKPPAALALPSPDPALPATSEGARRVVPEPALVAPKLADARPEPAFMPPMGIALAAPDPRPAALDEMPELPSPAFGQARVPDSAPVKLAAAMPLGAKATAPGIAEAQLSPAPATRTYPVSDTAPLFTYDDELILEVRVAGYPGGDTVVAYGSMDGVYLPLGTLARILDLAITVSDDGYYASGWYLSEARKLSIDLRQHRAMGEAGSIKLHASDAVAFDGELYLRAERFADFLPLRMTADLRGQSVLIDTLEPFPFEERMKRDAERERLASRDQSRASVQRWPRQETPWLALSVPTADLELRALSDTGRGERIEGDVRLAGDIAFMSGQAFFGASSDKGLTEAHVELGRRDPDADLLGPLHATEFQLGDVSTSSMSIGLRGVSGRGAAITNSPIESLSLFETADLRGNLPDGYEVELYRNGVLVKSTRTPVNGRYEFTQIPLDFGINVFRLVFHGPQGQRYEEVRQFNVGDGRLPRGKLVYQFGVAQRQVNLLGVRGPEFSPSQDYGMWRATGQLSYGLTSGLTANLAGAWFESEGRQRWMGVAGLRTSLAGFAVKADLGLSDQGGKAAELGVGGKLMGASFTLSHAEYRGRFLDESRSLSGEFLNRATEFDANATITLGGGPEPVIVPISARLRRVEFKDGRDQISANLRGSARVFGAVISNTLDYSRNSGGGLGTFSQLVGNFDLATLGRSKTQVRLSVGYGIIPRPELVSTSVEVAHAVDDRTLVNASVGHGFKDKDTLFGLSAIRRFDRFTVAAEGKYGLGHGSHMFALRLGTSFGRDPLSGRFFLAEPGQAMSGSASIRAFQDLDGNGAYTNGDVLLPGVAFSSTRESARTNERGIAHLNGLGDGNRAAIQVDPATLPDIALAPVSRGIEVVPRPGRTHVADFPIVGLSDIEGTVYFDKGGASRAVAGVRLRLVDRNDAVFRTVRTEVDGYYFFEQVPPGEYRLVVDPEQAARLGICLGPLQSVVAPPQSDRVSRDLVVRQCAT